MLPFFQFFFSIWMVHGNLSWGHDRSHTKFKGSSGSAVLTFTGFRHPNRQAKYLYIKLQTLFVCPIITQGPICLKFWLRNLVGSRECCDFGFEILSWVVLLLYEKTAKIVIYDKARVGSNLEYLVGISRIPTYSTNCLWEITETFKLGLASITTNT